MRESLEALGTLAALLVLAAPAAADPPAGGPDAVSERPVAAARQPAAPGPAGTAQAAAPGVGGGARSWLLPGRFPVAVNGGPWWRSSGLAALRARALAARVAPGGGSVGPAERGPGPPADDGRRQEPPGAGVGDPPAGGPPVALDFAPPAARAAVSHVVVRFAPGVPGWQRRQIATAAGGSWFEEPRFGDFARVGVAPGDGVGELRRRLSGIAGVTTAEEDPLVWGAAVGVTAADGVAGAAEGFSDPHYALQWVFDRVRLAEAVDLNPTAGDGVVVAVIDSGAAKGGGAEFPARRGLDLEGTRFLAGLDLVDGGPPLDEGIGDAFDPDSTLFGHGTYAAAQIAATVDNGVAGASVAPRAVILPIRILNTDNLGATSHLAEAIDYAVSEGARVINMSLQGFEDAGFLRDAVRRAAEAGVVMVAAAGNFAEDPGFDGEVSFPARYPEVIAVGASTFADRRASYSSFGPSLELMAPAGEDASFVTETLRDASLAASFLHDPVDGSTLYASFWGTGTSFAAPQVAGAAALLIAAGIDDPDVVRQLLTVTTRDLGPAGFDSETAHGLLDLLEAHRGFGLAF